MLSGEDRAWQNLREAGPYAVCKNAAVEFADAAGLYLIRSFGMEFSIDPGNKTMGSPDACSGILLGRLSYFFRLSVLWYLSGAKDLCPSGRLVKPENLTGGLSFFRGSHALPLAKVAEQYACDAKGFMEKGVHFGGTPVRYGDAAFVLLPFPKIPVTVILWTADDEFEARVELLLDTTCEFHLPIDIIWNISMMSLLLLL